MSDLHAQARSYGIATDYYDVKGGYHVIADETLRHFVGLFEQAAQDATSQLSGSPSSGSPLFDDVRVVTADTVMPMASLALPSTEQPITGYQLCDEEGQAVATSSLSDDGTLPALPVGYYTLIVHYADPSPWRCRLIAAPETAYRLEQAQTAAPARNRQPHQPHQQRHRQLFGLTLQLYSLRSSRNWGIGDFADLAETIAIAGAQGYDFIGINPLHALYPSQPGWHSPYSPSSRRWLNWIYLSPEDIPEFSQNPTAQTWFTEQQLQLQQLRDVEYVDYTSVTVLKMQALRIAFAELETGASTILDQRRQALTQFIEAGGEALRREAVFHALNQRLNSLSCIGNSPDNSNMIEVIDSNIDSNIVGWLRWAPPFADVNHPYVQQFIADNPGEIRFYSYLQWLLTEQLHHLDTLCRQHGLTLGLYGDLAVGVARGSADVWADPSLYFVDESIGAPPDPLGPVGQDWQLPPFNPDALKRRGFQPIIDVLRANMRHFGALRIDHVMGLYRLWLIPAGKTAAQGAYIHYPFETLMAILAVESQRNHCVIIGEDLGTVPDEVRDALNRYCVLSYKVLYFSDDADCLSSSLSSSLSPSLGVIGTHDLPPLKGWWHCRDLDVLDELGILSGQALQDHYHQRLSDKQRLLKALKDNDFLPKNYDGDAMSMAMHRDLNDAIHAYAAVCGSHLFGIQPENFCHMEAAFNVPGTTTELPNWRRKLPLPLSDFIDDLPFRSN